MLYEMTPKAVAALDQAKAILRDGGDELTAAQVLGLNADDKDKVSMLRLLLAVDDLGGIVEIDGEE